MLIKNIDFFPGGKVGGWVGGVSTVIYVIHVEGIC